MLIKSENKGTTCIRTLLYLLNLFSSFCGLGKCCNETVIQQREGPPMSRPADSGQHMEDRPHSRDSYTRNGEKGWSGELKNSDDLGHYQKAEIMLMHSPKGSLLTRGTAPADISAAWWEQSGINSTKRDSTFSYTNWLRLCKGRTFLREREKEREREREREGERERKERTKDQWTNNQTNKRNSHCHALLKFPTWLFLAWLTVHPARQTQASLA